MFLLKINSVRDFKKMKRRYTGFFVEAKLKKGNGNDVSGIIAPEEIEIELLSYLGISNLDSNFLFIIKQDNSCSYLCAKIIDRIDVDLSKKCVIN